MRFAHNPRLGVSGEGRRVGGWVWGWVWGPPVPRKMWEEIPAVITHHSRGDESSWHILLMGLMETSVTCAATSTDTQPRGHSCGTQF